MDVILCLLYLLMTDSRISGTDKKSYLKYRFCYCIPKKRYYNEVVKIGNDYKSQLLGDKSHCLS